MRSDNAGGGVRGLRARPSQALFNVIQAAYKIEIETEPADLGGSSNLNLLVTDQSSRWELRVYRPYVTVQRLEAIHAVRQALSHAGVPCGGLVTTHDGQPWISFGGRLVELEHYIEHDTENRREG
jgi:Ser/Thr protein kinase RdoA (MazF antagonist)